MPPSLIFKYMKLYWNDCIFITSTLLKLTRFSLRCRDFDHEMEIRR